MNENNTSERIKNYLMSGRLHKADAAVAAVLIVLIVILQMVSMPLSEALNDSTEVSYGYKAVEADGLYYVIDSGHARAICFNKDGKAEFELTQGPDGEGLYIDEISVGKDCLYISTSVWDGMLLAGEQVLKYDLDGKYIETVTDNDYASDGETVNKHKLYGLHASDEGVSYAACLRDKVVFYTNGKEVYSLKYDNAFNAVSDIAISGNDLIILNKNGEIRRFDPSGKDTLVYTTDWAAQRIRVPFRIGVNGDEVLFTDIRTQTALTTNTAAETAVILAYETDSQTVTATEDGKGVLLTDSEGLRVTGDKDTVYTTVRKSTPVLIRQAAFLFALFFEIAAVLIVLCRFVSIMRARRKEGAKMSGSDTLVVLGLAAFVGVIVSAMLLNAFEDSYKDKIREQLKTTAYVVAAGIDESDLDDVVIAKDYGNEAYNNLCTTMKHAIPMNVEFSRTAYCNIMRLSDEGSYGYAIAYLDESIGTFFRVDDFEKKELQEVYDTGKPVWNDESADVSGTYLSVKVPIKGDDDSVVGVVAVGADTYVVQDMISAMRSKVLLSIVAIVLLLWIVISEATSFVKARSEYNLAGSAADRMPPHLVRILIFTIFSAYNLVSSFLPVYILRNSDTLPEAWRSTGAALPMTVNIFVMGIMSLFCAKAVRRLGIKRVFMISMLCSLAGNLIIVILPGYAPIMTGLILDGIGVGLITNAVYVMLTYLPDESERQEGFAIYNTASLSGINFGMILGGLLATNVGQRNVFVVAAIFWAALLLLGSYLTGTLAGILKAPDEEEDDDRHTAGKFLRHKSIWSFIVLIQNPYIIFNSFVFYFVPLFSDGLGYGEVMASVFLMLYSETAVMLGKSLPDKAEKTLGSRALYAAVGLNVLAVAIFTLTWNVQGLIVALLLLGLSASFAKPSQQSYFLGLKPTQKYGEDKAMGLYNFSENIGESLGPVVFGRLMAGTQAGIMAFLGLIVALGGAHFALNGKEIHKNAGN
ncbi:MAG: MFS transporter [Clostridiales bacterium]|nr:MFS transporter [Clostridiales bacterium]